MANTFTKIASVSVGLGGAATATFSSIPQTYTDLKILMSVRDTNTNGAVSLGINGSYTGTAKRLNGQGTAASSDSAYYAQADGTNETASVFSNLEIYIPNYAGSTNKSSSWDVAVENNGATLNNEYMSLIAGLVSNTAAVTSIVIAPNLLWAQYSIFTLYGIKSS